MLPKVTVDGRLAAEPELRFSGNGNAVARLRLVASDRRRNEAGEWEDSDTLWLDATAFGKLAENICESVQKGDLLVVTGRLRTEEWNDRDTGQKRSKISLLVDTAAASLQFRVLPHGGETHRQRAVQREQFANPVQQAYGSGQEDPPF